MTEERITFADGLRFEWIKFTTLRSNLVLVGVLAAALPLLSVVVAATGSLQPDDTILGASVLGGAIIAQVLAATIGATSVTGEIRTGMMRTTLLASPRQLWVLAAKSVVAAGVVAVVLVPSTVLAFGIGVAVLDGDRYATGQLFPAVLGVALAIASMTVLGVAIGSLVRHAGGAIVTGVTVVLLPMIVAPMLGDLQRWVGGASLGGVMQKLTQSSDATHETVGSLGAWPSLGIVGLYTMTAVALAVWVMRRRDS